MEKSKYKNKQGSILIGVIIIFLMISSLSVAIVSRSLQGTILTTDSKKGYIAYQNSDKNTENFLNSFKTLDNNGGGNKIPENSNALNFCGSATCSNATEGTLSSTNKVADIFSFKATGAQNQGATRAIFAPVPERINGKLAQANLVTKNCNGTTVPCTTGGENSYNSCDMSVKVNASSFDPLTMKNYEVRKSISDSLAYGAVSGQTYGWQKVIGNVAGGYFDKVDSKIIKNGDASRPTLDPTFKTGGQYGLTYYFTIKARNKNPFTLDSLYLADSSGKALSNVVIEPSTRCSGGDSLSNLNCIRTGTNPAGTETYNQTYNCCNGTECYHPSLHWEKNPTLNCALQKCEYGGDQVGINPTGDSTTGYCREKTLCLKGRDCTYPYRTVAYCTATPVPSSQIPGSIVSSNWSFQKYQDVYMSPSSDKSNKYPDPPNTSSQPRCSRHDCPTAGSVVASPVTNYCEDLPYHGDAWDATGTSCSPATCGDYSLTKSCVLSCKTPDRYSPYSSAPGYSKGKDCTEVCPSETAPFTSNDPQTTEGACSYTLPSYGTSWTNNSSCQSNTRPATTSQHGYTVTESCVLSCSSINLGYYPVNNSGSTPSSACCYENCPTDTRTKACTAGSCSGVCGGFSDTRTEWDKSCSDYSCNCGVETHCTPDCAGTTNGTCKPEYYCGSAPWWCSCGYSGSCSGYSCSSSGPTDTRTCNATYTPRSCPAAPSCGSCGSSGSCYSDSCSPSGYTDDRSCNEDPPACDPMTCEWPKQLYGSCYSWCGWSDTRRCL